MGKSKIVPVRLPDYIINWIDDLRRKNPVGPGESSVYADRSGTIRTIIHAFAFNMMRDPNEALRDLVIPEEKLAEVLRKHDWKVEKIKKKD